MENLGPQNLKDILAAKMANTQKPPAYEWQDLALRIIRELAVPNFKRNSVFKVCKQFPKVMIEKALNETKELCKDGGKWKYFFKVLTQISTQPQISH